MSVAVRRFARRTPIKLKGAAVYLPLIFLALLRFAPGVPTTLAYVALAIFALFGRSNAILALVLSWLFTLANPGIVGVGGGSAERYLVLLAAFVSVVIQSFRSRIIRIDGFVIVTCALVLFLIGHSVLLSPMVEVSLLKAISWGIAMITSLLAWLGLSDHDRAVIADRVFWVLAIVMLCSLPLLVTSVGFLRNGSGFQGVLNHPQAFGLAMGTFTAWSAARLLEARRPTWIQVGLTGIGLAMVLMSGARTAGLAIVLAVALAVTVKLLLKAGRVQDFAPGFLTPRFWITAFIGFLAGVGAAGSLWQAIQQFLVKGTGRRGSILDLYDVARGALIDAMMANISNDPWRGIGFGIASIPSLMVVERDSFLGLPTGAAVEKGIAPLAVLEETGIVGFVFVLVWVAWLFVRGAKGGLASLTVLLMVLILNFGENTLFSPGGYGLLAIVLFGWVCASGAQQRHV
jgi:hypothetical protein